MALNDQDGDTGVSADLPQLDDSASVTPTPTPEDQQFSTGLELGSIFDTPKAPANTWDQISSSDDFKKLDPAAKEHVAAGYALDTRDYLQSQTGADANAIDQQIHGWLQDRHKEINPPDTSFGHQAANAGRVAASELDTVGGESIAGSIRAFFPGETTEDKDAVRIAQELHPDLDISNDLDARHIIAQDALDAKKAQGASPDEVKAAQDQVDRYAPGSDFRKRAESLRGTTAFIEKNVASNDKDYGVDPELADTSVAKSTRFLTDVGAAIGEGMIPGVGLPLMVMQDGARSYERAYIASGGDTRAAEDALTKSFVTNIAFAGQAHGISSGIESALVRSGEKNAVKKFLVKATAGTAGNVITNQVAQKFEGKSIDDLDPASTAQAIAFGVVGAKPMETIKSAAHEFTTRRQQARDFAGAGLPESAKASQEAADNALKVGGQQAQQEFQEQHGLVTEKFANGEEAQKFLESKKDQIAFQTADQTGNGSEVAVTYRLKNEPKQANATEVTSTPNEQKSEDAAPKFERWQDAAKAIQNDINRMPVGEALPLVNAAIEHIKNDPKVDVEAGPGARDALLQQAQRAKVGLEQDAQLKQIAEEKGRQHFDVNGWLAQDFGDKGWGHVVGGDVLVKVAVDGDGHLDPKYNVDGQGIFVNRGPGQAARIRLQNKGGMAPLVFNDAKLAENGIEVQKNAEGVINQKVPLDALNPEAKLRAVDVIFNELDRLGRPIDDNVVRKVAANLGMDEADVQARVNPKADANGPAPQAGGVEIARTSAEDYVKKSGVGSILPPSKDVVDPERARQIAKDYEALPPVDDSPRTKSSYAAFGAEVNEQFRHAQDQGIKFEFTKDDPYKSSAEMMKDLHENGRLRVYTGGEDHPYLGESTKDADGLTLNDKFRAVHDLYGHASEGNQFGPNGEERAWRKHAAMFSREARPAMTAETRGQNSWVNHGPHMYDENGYWKGNKTLADGKPNPNYIAPKDRPFAQQKAALLPPEHSQVGSKLAVQAHEAITKKGGVTLNLNGNEPAEGFSFAPDKSTETKHVPHEFQPEHVDAFLEKHRATLEQEGNHLGGWIDREGKPTLDVSRVSSDKLDALVRARDAKQDAIFDHATGKEIDVKNGLAQFSPAEIRAAEQRIKGTKVSGEQTPERNVGGVQGKGDRARKSDGDVPSEVEPLKPDDYRRIHNQLDRSFTGRFMEVEHPDQVSAHVKHELRQAFALNDDRIPKQLKNASWRTLEQHGLVKLEPAEDGRTRITVGSSEQPVAESAKPAEAEAAKPSEQTAPAARTPDQAWSEDTHAGVAQVLKEKGIDPESVGWTRDAAEKALATINKQHAVRNNGRSELRETALDAVRDDLLTNARERGNPLKAENGKDYSVNARLQQKVGNKAKKLGREVSGEGADTVIQNAASDNGSRPHDVAESDRIKTRVRDAVSKAFSSFGKSKAPTKALPDATKAEVTKAAKFVYDQVLRKATGHGLGIGDVPDRRGNPRWAKLADDKEFQAAVQKHVAERIAQDLRSTVSKDRDTLASIDDELKNGRKNVRAGVSVAQVVHSLPEEIQHQVRDVVAEQHTDQGLHGVLDEIKAAPDATADQKLLANELKKVSSNVPVDVDPTLKAGNRAGEYSFVNSRLRLNPNVSKETRRWTALHEGIHHVVGDKIEAFLNGDHSRLSREDVAALTELESLRKEILAHESTPDAVRRIADISDVDERTNEFVKAMDDPNSGVNRGSHYGLTDLHEFATDVLTSHRFQDFLASVDSKQSFLTRALDTIKRLVFGKTTGALDRAFNSAMDLVKSGRIEGEASGTIHSVNTASNRDVMLAKEIRNGKSIDQVARENQLTPKEVEAAYDRALETKARLSGDLPSLEDRISQRVPTAAKSTEDALKGEPLETGLKSVLSQPEHAKKLSDLVRTYGIKDVKGRTPAEVLGKFVDHVKGNLLWLHDHMAPDLRERASKWYEGANKLTGELAEEHNQPQKAVAGVTAALSPQREWFQNVSLAKRVLDTYSNHQDTPWSPEMGATLKRIFAKPEFKNLRKDIDGKTFSQLDNNYDRAAWLRVYDEAHNPRSHQIISPEGDVGDLAKNKDGTPTKVAWGTVKNIENALHILDDSSRENISKRLGEEHKVRNFFNNITAPWHGTDVTVDTHAVAAGRLLPIGGTSEEVGHNFGTEAPSTRLTGDSGMYPVYAEAYRQAAAERGILPRQMQSITWEAVRGLFSPEMRRDKKFVAHVRDLWKSFNNGKTSIDETRNSISKIAGGISAPEWAARPEGTNGEGRGSLQQGELSDLQLPRGTSEPVDSGARVGSSEGAPGLHEGADRELTLPSLEDKPRDEETRDLNQAKLNLATDGPTPQAIADVEHAKAQSTPTQDIAANVLPHYADINESLVKLWARTRATMQSLKPSELWSAWRNAADTKAEVLAGQKANDVFGTLREAMGRKIGDKENKIDRQALSFAVEADGDKTNLANFRNEIQAAIGNNAIKKDFRWRKAAAEALEAIDHAEANWDKLKPAVDKFNSTTGNQIVLEHLNGINTPVRSAYVPHVQERDTLTHLFGAGSAPEAGTGFKKMRSFDTFAESISNGVNPKSLDAIDLLNNRVKRGLKAINLQQWAEAGRSIVDPSSKLPLVSDVTPVTHPVTGQTMTEVPKGYVQTTIGNRPIAVHEGYSGLFQNLTEGSRIRNNKAGAALLGAEGVVKHGLLLFDSYHLGRLAYYQLGLRGLHAVDGSFNKGLLTMDYSPTELRAMERRGELPDGITANDMIKRKGDLDKLIAQGFNVGSISDNLNSHLVEHIPVIGTFNKFVFQKFQRGGMAMSGLIELERQRKAFPNLSDAEVTRKVAKELNTRFGNLKKEGWLKSATMRDLSSLTLLAPGWNEGLLRSEGRFVKEAGTALGGLAQGQLKIGSVLKSSGTLMAGMFVANQLINYITRGHPTWDNPEEGINSKISAYIPDYIGGGPGFFLNPLSLPMEISHQILQVIDRGATVREALAQVAGYKISPLLRAGFTLATGRDGFGRKINSEGGVFKEAGNDVVPAPMSLTSLVQTGLKSAQQGKPTEQTKGATEKQLVASAGVKLDSAPSARARMFNLAKAYNKAHNVPADAGESTSDYANLTQALDTNDHPRAQKEYEKLAQTKTDKQIYQHFAKMMKPGSMPFTHNKRAEAGFYKSLNAEQKETYKKALKERQDLGKSFFSAKFKAPKREL